LIPDPEPITIPGDEDMKNMGEPSTPNQNEIPLEDLLEELNQLPDYQEYQKFKDEEPLNVPVNQDIVPIESLLNSPINQDEESSVTELTQWLQNTLVDPSEEIQQEPIPSVPEEANPDPVTILWQYKETRDTGTDPEPNTEDASTQCIVSTRDVKTQFEMAKRHVRIQCAPHMVSCTSQTEETRTTTASQTEEQMPILSISKTETIDIAPLMSKLSVSEVYQTDYIEYDLRRIPIAYVKPRVKIPEPVEEPDADMNRALIEALVEEDLNHWEPQNIIIISDEED
jgi:hypothetical protein